MKQKVAEILKTAALCCFALQLAGCSSPPEPPQPMGEKVAINPSVKQPVITKPAQEQQPVLVTSPRPVDVHEFDDLRPKYRK